MSSKNESNINVFTMDYSIFIHTAGKAMATMVFATTLLTCFNSCEANDANSANPDYPDPPISQKLLDTGLPLVQIETVNHEELTCDYVSPPEGLWGATIRNSIKVPGRIVVMKDTTVLYDSKEYEKGNSGMTIKIRGNTSAYTDKKPYKIKLEKKADLLFRGDDEKFKDKEWVLLKYDSLKALVGFKLNELMQMQWTPRFQFVNVMLNGDNKGLYMLVESVKRNNKCRLNVSDDGYIFECDSYFWNEDVYFNLQLCSQMNYTFKYPDEDDVTEEQISYIQQYTDSLVDTVIWGNGPYDNYIDVDSWARWLLSHDILGTDIAAGSNIYITKYDNTSSSKLKMGNLWDFDNSYQKTNDWSQQHTFRNFYFPRLLENNNEKFKNAYRSLWGEIYPNVFSDMIGYLNEFEKSDIASSLDKSIIIDNIRWNSNFTSVSEELKVAKSWFSSRAIFLKNNIPNL